MLTPDIDIASTLSGLALHIPIENLLIPPSAYLTDRKLCNEIYAPYSSGKRAFAVKEPLPFSSAGTHRLPRVLRETTSFVIADPVIKTEGIFRISPRATIVDILKEAYDRGQKFIVWKERNVSMSQGHMKEGTGTVYVEELEHTEGYDVHAAAAVIKQWYRELRDPIFPPSCYPALERFYGASYSETETPLQVSQLLEILAVGDEWSPITEASRIILTMHLLPLLSRVIEYQEWNQMTAYNLAVCFAPCLLRGHDPMEDVKISSIIRRILMALIMHWKADLAPKFEAGQQNFEDLLRLPEAIEDREDPLQEAQEPRSSLETQVTGVTLIDNEDSDEEIEESPPPLPPRPVTSPVENTLADGTAVRRKPAPPIQTLPRYSMIVNDTPVTLEHIPFYNTVAPEDEMQPPRGLDSLQELPEYEPSLARLSNCDTQQKPLGDKRHVEELRDRGGPLAEPSDSNAQQRLSKSIHDAEELKDQKGSFSIESPPFLTVAQMSSSSSANAQESSEPENPSPVAPSPVLSPTLVTRKPLPSARSGP